MKTFLSRLPCIPVRCKGRITPVFVALLLSLMLLAGAATAQEPAKQPSGAWSVEDILNMVKSGLRDDLIISAIKSKGKAFDLNAAEMSALAKSGVSQTVIEYMLDPAKPYAVPVPPAPAPPAGATPLVPPSSTPPTAPLDPVVAKVPPDSGLYYLADTETFSKLDLKPLVPAKQPGKNSKLFGLLKGDIVGSIVDANAKLRLPAGAEAIFFIRLPEKATVDDYALLRLEPGKARRDLDFGSKPGKPVFPFTARASFEHKQVAPGLYRLSVRLTQPGEYLFFILGSGDESKGLLGKGYDFAID
jgi:hypothetical protein